MIQPYTHDDLKRAESVVIELHGLKGFEAWAERIAKEIAAERERVENRSIDLVADLLADWYPDNASTRAFCAAIRSLKR